MKQTAYLHDDSLKKQFELNVPFFRNVLGAVADLNDSTLQRVVLQTGAKHYGFAYKAPTGDPPTGPVTEALGRSAQDGPPNFYYGQEDFMFELQKGKKWTWNVYAPLFPSLARPLLLNFIAIAPSPSLPFLGDALLLSDGGDCKFPIDVVS